MNFPSSPTVGQTYTLGSKTWVWNGSAWDLQSAAPNNLTLDYVQLNTSATVTDAVGRIRWDADQGTADLGLLGGNIVQRLGQTLVAYVTNAEAVTITKGQAVYLFSAVGDRASVKLAYNTADAASSKTLGIVAEDIAAGASGFVMCQGVAYKMNTAAYNAGDVLYLGATAGSITTTKPYAPNHLVYLGVVEKANAGNGQIYVRVQNGYEMDELHNVSAQSPTTGQTIVYNASTGLWEKNTVSLTAGVNGVLPTTNGGTNLTSFTSGGVVYASSSSALATGSALTFNGTNEFKVIAATGTAYSRTESTQHSTFLQLGAGNANVFYEFSAGTPLRWVDTSAGELMRLNSTGLGIGTSSPTNKLQVSGSTSNVATIVTNTNTAGQASLSLATNQAALYSAAFGSTAGGTTWAGLTGNKQTVIEAQDSSSFVIGAFNNSAPIIFAQGRAETARFPVNGGFQSKTTISVGDAAPSTSGAGITFPATQSASSNANTLDDYEEGTWTPALGGFSSITYSAQTGTYTKIGNVVNVVCKIVVSGGTRTSQDLQIFSLPFTSASQENSGGSWGYGYGVVASSVGLPQLRINASDTTVSLLNTAGVVLAGTDLNTATPTINFSATYTV